MEHRLTIAYRARTTLKTKAQNKDSLPCTERTHTFNVTTGTLLIGTGASSTIITRRGDGTSKLHEDMLVLILQGGRLLGIRLGV